MDPSARDSPSSKRKFGFSFKSMQTVLAKTGIETSKPKSTTLNILFPIVRPGSRQAVIDEGDFFGAFKSEYCLQSAAIPADEGRTLATAANTEIHCNSAADIKIQCCPTTKSIWPWAVRPASERFERLCPWRSKLRAFWGDWSTGGPRDVTLGVSLVPQTSCLWPVTSVQVTCAPLSFSARHGDHRDMSSASAVCRFRLSIWPTAMANAFRLPTKTASFFARVRPV